MLQLIPSLNGMYFTVKDDIGKVILQGSLERCIDYIYNTEKRGLTMRQKEAYKIIRSYGCTVSKKDNEYRINCKFFGTEGTAYYTDDLQDAIDTAKIFCPCLNK